MKYIILTLSVVLLTAKMGTAQFEGGDGSIDDPYQVATVEQLQEAGGPDHFIQTENIDASDFDFSPLDDLTGSYDGDGHVISNLTIDTDDDLHVGLFSVIAGGEVRNLGLEDLDLIAPDGEMVGGITGVLTANGLIENVYVTGEVDGWLMVSGIVGHVVDGIVDNTYAHVTVDADDTQNAGVAGRLSADGEVYNSYAVAEVTGGDWYGVVVGNNDGGTVANIYWDVDESSPADGIGFGDEGTNVHGLTTEDMTGEAAAENMAALDFETIWTTTEDDYPTLTFDEVPVDDHTAIEPPEDEDTGLLQTFPHSFNMGSRAINWNDYTFFPFEGAVLARVTNPDKSGLNENDFVLEYEKTEGSEPWAGFFYRLSDEVYLSDESTFSMKVWSPRSDVEASLKFEQHDGDLETNEFFAEITESGEWIELEWDLEGIDPEEAWDVVTIIMELETAGEGGEDYTWYLDEFSLEGVAEEPGEVEPPPGIVITEPDDEDISSLQPFPFEFNMDTEDVDWEDYTFFPFEGAILSRMENPDASGMNESDYVLRYEKGAGSAAWAGFFYRLEEAVNINDESTFKMKVWSPRSDIDAIMKLEEQDSDLETDDQFAEITEAEEWIELEWDLSGLADADWDMVTIIFDLDMDNPPTGGEDDTWFVDGLRLENVEEVTSSEVVDYELPADVELEQNYPNPFNPTTQIEFALPQAEHATLEIYNALGQKVETLVDEELSAGQHSFDYDASHLSSGTYIYRLQAGDQINTKTMTLIK